MGIVNLLISLISGAVGGNVAGAAMPNKSLGTAGNSVAGLFGGGISNFVLQTLGILSQVSTQAGAAATTAVPSFDITSILANVGTSGVSGAVLMVVISLIKNVIQKRS